MAKSIFWYEQGLLEIAEKRNISVPDAVLIALDDIIAHGYNNLTPIVLASASALNPGDTYTKGLRKLAKTDESLIVATHVALDDAKSSGSTEHFAPISAACTWLIGRTVKS